MADPVNDMQYTLSVVPTLNDAVQAALMVTSGNSANQAGLALTAHTLAVGASTPVISLPADGKGFGAFGTGRFDVRLLAGGTSTTVPLHQYPETNTPGSPYKVAFFLPGIVSQVQYINPDPDDSVDLITIG